MMKLIFAMLSIVLVSADMAVEAAAPGKPGGISPGIIPKFSKFDSIIDNTIKDATKTRMSDPIRFIARDMKSVEGDLSQYQTDKPVQEKEEKVVGQLDEVIKLLEATCKKGKAGGSLNPSKPMPD